MPKYIDRQEISGLNQTPKDNDLTQLDKINNMLDKGLKIFDKIGTLRKYREEQQAKGMNQNQIEIKAGKEAERITRLNSPPQNLNIPAEPIPQKEFEIVPKVKEAEAGIKKFIENIKEEDKKKTLGEFLEKDFKKWEEAGLVHVFIESALKDYTELKEK